MELAQMRQLKVTPRATPRATPKMMYYSAYTTQTAARSLLLWKGLLNDMFNMSFDVESMGAAADM